MKQVLHRALVRDGECDGEWQHFIIYLHNTGHSLPSSQILTCFEQDWTLLYHNAVEITIISVTVICNLFNSVLRIFLGKA